MVIVVFETVLISVRFIYNLGNIGDIECLLYFWFEHWKSKV